MKSLISAACVAALLPFAAFAQDATHTAHGAAAEGEATNGQIAISNGYLRSSGKMSGAAYMQITNQTDHECRLDAVTTTEAKRAEVHDNLEVDGVMKMEKAEPVVLAAGASHEFVRGGQHVMLMGLSRKFENGQTMPLNLDFGDCGTISLVVPVDNNRDGKGAGAQSEMDHSKH